MEAVERCHERCSCDCGRLTSGTVHRCEHVYRRSYSCTVRTTARCTFRNCSSHDSSRPRSRRSRKRKRGRIFILQRLLPFKRAQLALNMRITHIANHTDTLKILVAPGKHTQMWGNSPDRATHQRSTAGRIASFSLEPPSPPQPADPVPTTPVKGSP